MRYEGNPKHKQPWQRGRRGLLCPGSIDREKAQALLSTGGPGGGKRYAVHEGRACCAQRHGDDSWHGYPVGWVGYPKACAAHGLRRGACRDGT